MACAVSCTGSGEYFVRQVVAHEISARMRYCGETIEIAADSVLFDGVVAQGGSGGLVAVDRQGNFCMPFSTSGMYRGAFSSAAGGCVGIHRELTSLETLS